LSSSLGCILRPCLKNNLSPQKTPQKQVEPGALPSQAASVMLSAQAGRMLTSLGKCQRATIRPQQWSGLLHGLTWGWSTPLQVECLRRQAGSPGAGSCPPALSYPVSPTFHGSPAQVTTAREADEVLQEDWSHLHFVASDVFGAAVPGPQPPCRASLCCGS
jgi:hypothetical protein